MDSFTGMSLIRDNIPCNKQDTVLNTGDTDTSVSNTNDQEISRLEPTSFKGERSSAARSGTIKLVPTDGIGSDLLFQPKLEN